LGGFGFANIQSDMDIQEICTAMDGEELEGRHIRQACNGTSTPMIH